MLKFRSQCFCSMDFWSVDKPRNTNSPTGHCHKAFSQNEALSKPHLSNSAKIHHQSGRKYRHPPSCPTLRLRLSMHHYFEKHDNSEAKTDTQPAKGILVLAFVRLPHNQYPV